MAVSCKLRSLQGSPPSTTLAAAGPRKGFRKKWFPQEILIGFHVNVRD